MQIRSIHPFPARMAPELALDSLRHVPEGSLVLDPMAGSGTVLRQATALGLRAVGFDMDPLAVLMGRVWTTPVADVHINEEFRTLVCEAQSVDLRTARLPWLDSSRETKEFVSFWFGNRQRRDLKRLAFALHFRSQEHLRPNRRAALDVLKLALSRIIITKEQGASLARDTSHSRPHKVADDSDYDVFAGFERSVSQIRKRLLEAPPTAGAAVSLGDARNLHLTDSSVDAVVTSPPYLNAIDYLRGHRMALVWLGHDIGALRKIRSASIGAERASDSTHNESVSREVADSMCNKAELSGRAQAMVERYAVDLLSMTSEISRVLRVGGRATFVVGNSCLKGAFIQNSVGVIRAAEIAGMTTCSVVERELPQRSRYLPITDAGSLSKRMRTETVITFAR